MDVKPISMMGEMNSTQADLLVSGGVNPIWRNGANKPICVQGARTFDRSGNWKFAHHGHIWNMAAYWLQQFLDNTTYDAVDPEWFSQQKTSIYSRFASWAREGAFYGEIPAPGTDSDETNCFAVDFGPHLLSNEDINAGRLRVSVWFVPALTNERTTLTLAKRNL